jgi:hypothetical protein
MAGRRTHLTRGSEISAAKSGTEEASSVDVLMQHVDKSRTGAYHDDMLNWGNVNVNSFGKVNELSTHGFIWAQPLFVSDVSVPGKGSKNDLIIVATAENWLYAFDAKQPQGSDKAVVWAHQFGLPVPSRSFGNGSGDIYQSTVGILGTPVIEIRTQDGAKGGTIFAITWVWKPQEFDDNPEKAYSHYLIAVDLATGKSRSKKPDRIKIEGEVEGGGYAAAGIYAVTKAIQRDESHTTVKSTFAPNLLAIKAAERAKPRDWLVTDTIRENGKDFVRFNSAMQLHRPGLLLDDGIIYSAFGARADQDPYHGWVFAHSAHTLELKGVFCTSRHGQRAGIWQAAEGISADNGGNIYVATGNGDIFPAAGCYGDSLLKLKLNNRGLQLVGFSNAFEEPGKEDEDFGASSPTILPTRWVPGGGKDGTGWMAGGAKDGHLYLFEQEKVDPSGSPASVKQLFIASYDQQSKRKLRDGDEDYSHHIHGSPVVYDTGKAQYLYIWGENDLLRAFRFDVREGIFPGQPKSKDRGAFGKPDAVGEVFCSADGPRDSMHGGFLAVSADGQQSETGIVWASIPAFDNASQRAVAGELRAYKAVEFIPYADEADDSDEQHKAANLVQKDGLVTLWSSQCNLERDDAGSYPKFCCPTVAKGRVYLPSFAGGGKLLVYGLLDKDNLRGGYDIGFEPEGSRERPVFDGRTGLVFNGSACVRGGHVRLVEMPHLYQAGSVFFRDKVNVQGFSTKFVVESMLPDHFEDHHHPEQRGFVFTIQGASVYALGEPGAGFGYGADKQSPLTRKRKITRSIAIAFGLRNSVIEFYKNGAVLEKPNVRPAGINLRNKLLITIAYDGAALTIELKDVEKGFPFHHEQAIDIKKIVGAEAYVGFCGGSAEASGCTIDITKWRFP